MGLILQYKPSRQSRGLSASQLSDRGHKSAKILMFTGVRYERYEGSGHDAGTSYEAVSERWRAPRRKRT